MRQAPSVRALLALLPATLLACLNLGCQKDGGSVPPPQTSAQAAKGTVAPPTAPSSQPAGADIETSASPFAGFVSLDGSVGAEAVKSSDVLFIMAREVPAGDVPGRLVAVQRHANVTLPLRYEISSKDQMVPGQPFAGPFVVSARLDRDGDPMTKDEGDLYGTSPSEVRSGQAGVNLVLKAGMPANRR